MNTRTSVFHILSLPVPDFHIPLQPGTASKRIIAMATGAVCIISISWSWDGTGPRETVSRAALLNTDRGGQAVHILSLIRQWNTGEPGRCPKEYPPSQPSMVYDRRRKELYIRCQLRRGRFLARPGTPACSAVSDRTSGKILGYAGKDAGPAGPLLEALCKYEDHGILTSLREMILLRMRKDLHQAELHDSLEYIRNHLVHMADPERNQISSPTLLSLSIRIQAALKISKVLSSAPCGLLFCCHSQHCWLKA